MACFEVCKIKVDRDDSVGVKSIDVTFLDIGIPVYKDFKIFGLLQVNRVIHVIL